MSFVTTYPNLRNNFHNLPQQRQKQSVYYDWVNI